MFVTRLYSGRNDQSQAVSPKRLRISGERQSVKKAALSAAAATTGLVVSSVANSLDHVIDEVGGLASDRVCMHMRMRIRMQSITRTHEQTRVCACTHDRSHASSPASSITWSRHFATVLTTKSICVWRYCTESACGVHAPQCCIMGTGPDYSTRSIIQ